MTHADWKKHLGDAKFNELQKIADNDRALEAIEDVLCQEIKQDNLDKLGKVSDVQGNFFYAYIDKLGPALKNDELGEKLRSYHFALLALQRAVKALAGFKKSAEALEEKENDAI